MALIKKIGYGQVEPNHLSAQRTGQIYAQSPVEKEIKVLENGSFLKLDPANNELGTTGNGEWMLVYNEVKLYDVDRQGYKDFAQKAVETVRGELVPRVFKTNVGDVFTTNLAAADAIEGTRLTPVATSHKDGGKVGILTAIAEGEEADAEIIFDVIKVTTMPDRQAAIKVVRTK